MRPVEGVTEVDQLTELRGATVGIAGRQAVAADPAAAAARGPVCLGSSAASWRATPMRSRTWPGCFTTSKPATEASPLVGASSVQSIRTVVDLPAPFGPRKP